MSIKNVAILGGAFDPVHQDHIALAKLCIEKGFCEEVWFVPSPDRWDKKLNASPEDRFAMLENAISGIPGLVLSDFEIEMGDYRGSYVTMCALRNAYPDCHFRLLVGADSYSFIPHWRDPLNFFGTEFNGHLLLQEFELIVFSRKGYSSPDKEAHLEKGFAPLFFIGKEDGFEGHFSSTEIRKSLWTKRSVCPSGLFEKNHQYILEKGLYNE